MKEELVKDWMTREVITISPKTTLPEAHHLMITKQIRRLPVLKNKRLVGIITRGDIRGAEASGATSLNIWELNYILAKLDVRKIMTPQPIIISPEATLAEAAQVMLKHKISGLPVVDKQGNLVGIITESDIFRLVVRVWNQEG
ncbi:MAG TPA: CBS domain-containing protein [Anaerolineae bacterium]|nr:CBS domain-containing protein [Anaerolineae bacterium]